MFFALAALALYQTLSVLAQSSTSDGASYPESVTEYELPSGLQAILARNSTAWHYPTDLTRGIVPKTLHSHNDYWRSAPYYSALSVGAISVEADIWLVNGTLHVGHEASALTAERTFPALYVDPIVNTLQRENPDSVFVSGTTRNGVFDTDSTQTLYLWLDCKTEGASTFAAAIKALQPLRADGYLTTYNAEKGVTMGAVTVIGTGNTPESFFSDPSKTRDYFFDADLPELGSSGMQSNITSNVTLIASVSFGQAIGDVGMAGSGAFFVCVYELVMGMVRMWPLSEYWQKVARRAVPYLAMLWRGMSGDAILTPAQLSTIRSQIATAKSKGIGARYWDTPGWPVRIRNGLWRTFYEEGVALINVDDLEAAAFTEW